MNQQESDQIWQQLRFHIENFFSQTIANDVQRIEYKPQFITRLLEMTPDRTFFELKFLKSVLERVEVIGTPEIFFEVEKVKE
jgi:hypothetical protein